MKKELQIEKFILGMVLQPDITKVDGKVIS